MAFNPSLQGSVLYDADGNPVAVTLDGSIYRLSTLGHADEIARDDIVGVDYLKDPISATTYLLTIDLDNPGASYKHASGSGILIYGGSATLLKSSTGAEWRVLSGVITAIDGTQASVVWLEMFSVHVEDTGRSFGRHEAKPFPIPMDLTTPLSKIAAKAQVTTDVNTGVTLEDVNGDSRTPAVGDLISKVEKLSGSGSALLHQSIWYQVV